MQAHIPDHVTNMTTMGLTVITWQSDYTQDPLGQVQPKNKSLQ